MKTVHRIGAVIAGLLAGGLVVAAIEYTSSLVYPMPASVDPKNVDALAEWIGGLPMGAFLFILVAWAGGLFTGSFLGRRLAPHRTAIPGMIVSMLLTLGAIGAMVSIPHPFWFWFAGLAVCLVFGQLGLFLAAPSTYLVQTQRTIAAPLEKVFQTLATPSEFANAVPGITKVEFLTDQNYGIGTRFRETRVMHGKDATVELKVTELVENERIRMVSDEGGTVWDTVFTVEQAGNIVIMNMVMEARPYQTVARIITPMILGMVSKCVEQDMDSIKDYCANVARV